MDTRPTSQRYPESVQFCRINLVGEPEGEYYGPFDDFEPAARWGELATNRDEAFEIVGVDDLPEGVKVTAPEEVTLQFKGRVS